mgnify:CR=1 FL=1
MKPVFGAPVGTGVADHVGAFAITAGIGADAGVKPPTELQGRHRGRGAPQPAGRQKVGRELADGHRARPGAVRVAGAHPRAAPGALISGLCAAGIGADADVQLPMNGAPSDLILHPSMPDFALAEA